MDASYYRKVLEAGLNSLIEAEPEVTNFDVIAGDGDCGICLKRGAESILDMLEKSRSTDNLLVNLSRAIQMVETAMDGTSGALYSIFLNAVVQHLRQEDGPIPAEVTSQMWARALDRSLHTLSKYTPAQPGDRTMMDALHPFVQELQHSGNALQAAEAAKAGAEATRGMTASLGRTVYIGGDDWHGVPDPGAHGLSALLTGLASAL